MIHLKKLTLTLVALFAISAGAWAQTTVKYSFTHGLKFASGTTVEVKNGSDVVATVTYGESGGEEFRTELTTGPTVLEGYTAYTQGNGTNGNLTGGTFYTIVPVYDGSIDVAVVLNGNKAFYILEDGVALEGYNGITVPQKYYGTFTFSVSAGKSYKLYAAGAKLGFYGFEYTFGAAAEGTALTPDATRKVWTLDAMPAGNVELQVAYFPGMLTLPAKTAQGSIEVVGLGAATLPAGFDTDGTNIYVEPKTQFQVKAVPAEGYHLVSLSDGTNTYDVDADGIATVTMPEGDADLTLTATFSDEFELTFDDVNFKTNKNITVKVGDADKTLDQDGKLSVKAGQTVTLTAKQGYKFRGVEAKKGISTLKSVKIDIYTVYYAEGENWYQAFSRDENRYCGLETSVGCIFNFADKPLLDSGGNNVSADAPIDPSKGYHFAN